MRLIDYLDKGASLGRSNPCLTMNGVDMSYGDVQRLTYKIAAALHRSGVRPGDKVAVLSGNDPTAFACVFGLSRAGAVWCPINPRNEAAENCQLLEAFDCTCLIFQDAYTKLVEKIRPDLPNLKTFICLDAGPAFAEHFEAWTGGGDVLPFDAKPQHDIAMIAGTGGTTGQPKGVMLSERNLETMSAITLMSYPFKGRPVYLALAPLTHAAGVLCLPVMTLGGQIVIMPKGDLSEFLVLIATHRVTHVFLPPTLIYMLLEYPKLPDSDLSSLQCFWYGAAPISPTRLAEALQKITPCMAQLFGQTEAPMMISAMAPADHFNPDGSIAQHRLASAGRPAPLVQVGVMNADGDILGQGEHGEIVIRGSLVMPGYYKNPKATEDASRFGWHHTGDIGFLDQDNFLFIVDRAKDMIITGGFNVYSAEVEQALMAHPDIQDSAVIGLPDNKWGERVTAVIQLHEGRDVVPADIIEFVKARIGSVKAPKQIEIWPDLPRSRIGKVVKKDIKNALLHGLAKAVPVS